MGLELAVQCQASGTWSLPDDAPDAEDEDDVDGD
jgi:hypothetical protein